MLDMYFTGTQSVPGTKECGIQCELLLEHVESVEDQMSSPRTTMDDKDPDFILSSQDTMTTSAGSLNT